MLTISLQILNILLFYSYISFLFFIYLLSILLSLFQSYNNILHDILYKLLLIFERDSIAASLLLKELFIANIIGKITTNDKKFQLNPTFDDCSKLLN